MNKQSYERMATVLGEIIEVVRTERVIGKDLLPATGMDDDLHYLVRILSAVQDLVKHIPDEYSLGQVDGNSYREFYVRHWPAQPCRLSPVQATILGFDHAPLPEEIQSILVTPAAEEVPLD